MAEVVTTTGGNVSMRLKTWVGGVSRDGTTVSADVYVSMQPTDQWTSNQMAAWILANGTKYELRAAQVTGDYAEHTASARQTWTGVGLTDTSLTYSVGFGWNAYDASQGYILSDSFSFGQAAVWNDINAYTPEGNQNGLTFDLTTSDGGSWTDITNEPGDFTKLVGTTATISNIRCNTVGAHYSRNNVTNSTADPFTWTFNSQNFSVEIFSTWDTYTINYDMNGGEGDLRYQTKSYNQSITLRSDIPTRDNHDFLGWSLDQNATTPTWEAGDSFSENGEADGDILTLYAIWKPLYYNFNLRIWSPEGIERKDANTLGSVQMSVNDGPYQTVVDEPQLQYLYGSTFKFKNIVLAPGLRLSWVRGATWDAENKVYTATQGAEPLTITFETDYRWTKVKDNNTWKSGNLYIKKNGQWLPAKTVYMKQNGVWSEIIYRDTNERALED